MRNRNIYLLCNPHAILGTAILRRTTRLPPNSSGTGMRTLATLQYPIHTPILQIPGLILVPADGAPSCPARLTRLVLVCLPSAEGIAEFVGARDAGEFADGGDYLWADAGDCGGDDYERVLDVAPARRHLVEHVLRGC